MKVVLIGGFLGSGKTTVLMNLAKYIADKFSMRKNPVVIIENEIGEVSIDGKTLSDFTVKNMFSGCICCTLSVNLVEELKKLQAEYDPEYVLVETTGLADTGKVAEIIRKYCSWIDRLTVAVVVDCSRWFEIIDYMELPVTKQLEAAEIILLNKIDDCSKEDLHISLEQVRQINDKAIKLSISAKCGMQTNTADAILGIVLR